MEDTRLQLPIHWGELGEDAQDDLVSELAVKFGFPAFLIARALNKMDREGKCLGHIVVYEYDVRMEMGLQGDE